MIFVALPLSGLLNGWTAPRGDLGSSVSPVSPLPSQRLLQFPSYNSSRLKFSISWKSCSLVWLCTSAKAIDGNPVAWRELVGYLEITFLGPTEGWDSAFLKISSIKVDRPRVTSPLAFSGLGRGFEFFSGFFCLVKHTNQLLDSTQTKQQQIYRKAGRRVGLLHVPYIGSYLLFLKPNSSLAGSYTTLKKRQMATLFPRQWRQNVKS